MYLSIIILLIIVYLSVRERIYVSKMKRELYDLPVEPRETPISDAIVNLLASAGGIYVALLMFFSFLKMEIPETIEIYVVKFDPLAFTGFLIALIYPFFLSIKLQLERRKL